MPEIAAARVPAPPSKLIVILARNDLDFARFGPRWRFGRPRPRHRHPARERGAFARPPGISAAARRSNADSVGAGVEPSVVASGGGGRCAGAGALGGTGIGA